ncbi:hypothetical protein ACHAWX_007238 [Stephanocyclus meneghinianus]
MTSSSHRQQSVAQFLPADNDVDDAQMFLQAAEGILQTCSLSNIRTERGRAECQKICRDHSCCFLDEGSQPSYGCVLDPDKLCPVYAGCESLFTTETFYDGMPWDAESAEFNSFTFNITLVQEEMIPLSPPQGVPPFEKNRTETYQMNEGSESTYQTESSVQVETAELISHVISTVCANDYLHTPLGVKECAELCNSSMCCFDPTEIEILNPHIDIIFKLEGVSEGMLDRSAMGKCVNENETLIAQKNHFCAAHSGCKNLLMFGSSSFPSSKKRDPTSGGSSHYKIDIFLFDNKSTEQQIVTTMILFFAIMIGIAVYLLIYKRLTGFHPSESTESDSLVETIESSDAKDIV